MHTVSSYLREEREKKKYSYPWLEDKTKIKKAFLVAIENGNWNTLPEFPVLIGFVRNIATTLGADANKAVALLRRDYPPKQLKINPKPDVSKDFSWGPKATFLLGVSVIILLVFGYLTYQYITFTRPPYLEVISPQENEVLKQGKIIVSGKTVFDATVIVNNQSVLVSEDGTFGADLEVNINTKEIKVVAASRAGKETIVMRNIKVE